MVRLLDLTRSLRRAGRMPTGVDRVERAYLDRLLTDEPPAYGLIRTPFGYLLLDKTGMRALAHGDAAPARADLLSRLPLRRDPSLTQAETAVRRLALARCLPSRLRAMLQRHLPPGFDYYNVGHSNLTERVLRSIGYAGGRSQVLIHDVIPLELPQMQRPGTVRPFRDRLQRVARIADRVIYPSQDSREKAEAEMRGWGRFPPALIAPLGVARAAPDPALLPPGLPPTRPYLVSVGTIEPRKNHALLLDLWKEMGAEAPPLLICGSRGWNNDAVFARLDALPPDGPVRELAGLPDEALAALVQGAAGLLCPSLAEGFGLPPLEARALGTKVLVNDLPVFREYLDPQTVFAPVSEREKWLITIKDWVSKPSGSKPRQGVEVPDWDGHFNIVLR